MSPCQLRVIAKRWSKGGINNFWRKMMKKLKVNCISLSFSVLFLSPSPTHLLVRIRHKKANPQSHQTDKKSVINPPQLNLSVKNEV